MKILKQGSRVAGRNNEQVEVQETLEPIVADAKEAKDNEEPKNKPKKKRGRVIKLFAGCVLISLIIGGTIAYGTGIFDNFIKKHFGNDNDTNKDEITAIADSLPIDNNGIIEMTFPIVDRTLAETNGRYSLPEGMVPYFVNGLEPNISLSQTKNGQTENVIDYEANSENKPSGYIGLDKEYAGFMTRIEDIKVKIAAGDTAYTSPLESVNYEVSDLYALANGYDLYTEDEAAKGEAKLAYISNEGIKVYMIPSNYISKFIGVKTEIVELITKYEGLREQIIFAYNTYNNNSREYLGAIDEEATNRGR